MSAPAELRTALAELWLAAHAAHLPEDPSIAFCSAGGDEQSPAEALGDLAADPAVAALRAALDAAPGPPSALASVLAVAREEGMCDLALPPAIPPRPAAMPHARYWERVLAALPTDTPAEAGREQQLGATSARHDG